jgi:hypothetical protein
MPITDDAFWNALYAIGTEDSGHRCLKTAEQTIFNTRFHVPELVCHED